METNDFIKKISSKEPSKSPSQKFWDFCELAYCAFAKPTSEKEKQDILEARYMQIVGTYHDKDAIRAYPELIGLVSQSIQGGRDFLGVVAAEIGALSAAQGQFFTPYEVCRLMAEISLGDRDSTIEQKGYLTVDEPAAGSGGMVLAFADALERRGYDPMTQLYVRATDISALSYWMCFLQLSLAGIPAEVIRGNSLSLEVFESAYTRPAFRLFSRLKRLPLESEAVEVEPAIVTPTPVEIRQLALF
jgi:hypothetical protein